MKNIYTGKAIKKQDIFTMIFQQEWVCPTLQKNFYLKITSSMLSDLQAQTGQCTKLSHKKVLLDEDITNPSQTLRHVCNNEECVRCRQCPVGAKSVSGISFLPLRWGNVQTKEGFMQLPYYLCTSCGKLYMFKQNDSIKILDEEMSEARGTIRHACFNKKCMSYIHQHKCKCNKKPSTSIRYLQRKVLPVLDEYGGVTQVPYYSCNQCGDIYCFRDMMEELKGESYYE